MQIRPVVQFPETAQREWQTVAGEANARHEVEIRIRRATKVEEEAERLRVRYEANQIFQFELEGDAAPTLEMMTLATYKSTPAAVPVDLIDGVLHQDGVCLVLGPSGSGKSTLGLQMVHSLMTGDSWLDQPSAKMKGAAGILSYDMDAMMMMDWMDGFPNVDPDKVFVVNAYRRGNPLGVPAIRAQVANLWKTAGVEVVIVDSFSASFFGNDQNSAAETMAHYRDLKKFAFTECGARALIVIVHSSSDSPKKPRGSSVHHDVADSIVAVWAPDGLGGSRHAEMLKYRAARGHVMMGPRVLSTPDLVTHLVSVDYSEMAMAGMPPTPNATSQMFDEVPETHEAPDTDSDSGEEDDL